MDRNSPPLAVLPKALNRWRPCSRPVTRAAFLSWRVAVEPGCPGGALVEEEALLVITSRMRRILSVDLPNQTITVEPGVINSWVSRAVAGDGFYYAPDPSSQVICSIGGNVAENSGGVHCLKYGVTSNHVLSMQVVLPDGR